MVPWGQGRVTKEEQIYKELRPPGKRRVVQPPESREIAWFSQAGAGLEFSNKQ